VEQCGTDWISRAIEQADWEEGKGGSGSLGETRDAVRRGPGGPIRNQKQHLNIEEPKTNRVGLEGIGTTP